MCLEAGFPRARFSIELDVRGEPSIAEAPCISSSIDSSGYRDMIFVLLLLWDGFVMVAIKERRRPGCDDLIDAEVETRVAAGGGRLVRFSTITVHGPCT